jgi:restriction endonuclease S subunit
MVEMEKYKLGDICEIVSGSTPKTNIVLGGDYQMDNTCRIK